MRGASAAIERKARALRRRRLAAGLAATAVLTVGVAGCGSSGGEDTTSIPLPKASPTGPTGPQSTTTKPPDTTTTTQSSTTTTSQAPTSTTTTSTPPSSGGGSGGTSAGGSGDGGSSGGTGTGGSGGSGVDNEGKPDENFCPGDACD
jgi:hypothetical protein